MFKAYAGALEYHSWWLRSEWGVATLLPCIAELVDNVLCFTAASKIMLPIDGQWMWRISFGCVSICASIFHASLIGSPLVGSFAAQMIDQVWRLDFGANEATIASLWTFGLWPWPLDWFDFCLSNMGPGFFMSRKFGHSFSTLWIILVRLCHESITPRKHNRKA